MNPVWIEFPEIPWGSIGWRMGPGEDYLANWCSWYRGLRESERSDFKEKWPEPKTWSGFYDFIENGTTPPWVGKRRDEINAAAVPPDENEVLITDLHRVQGLLKNYFKAPSVSIRARDENFDILYCDPLGFIWGVQFPKDGTPVLKKYRGYLIGDDNLEVKQPIT